MDNEFFKLDFSTIKYIERSINLDEEWELDPHIYDLSIKTGHDGKASGTMTPAFRRMLMLKNTKTHEIKFYDATKFEAVNRVFINKAPGT